jgi:hypothetical protein
MLLKIIEDSLLAPIEAHAAQRANVTPKNNRKAPAQPDVAFGA